MVSNAVRWLSTTSGSSWSAARGCPTALTGQLTSRVKTPSLLDSTDREKATFSAASIARLRNAQSSVVRTGRPERPRERLRLRSARQRVKTLLRAVS
jgi:hypothetical protein